MASLIVCEGSITLPGNPGRLPTCDIGYTQVPYVEPTDTTALYAQLVALNEFDPIKIASMITFCLVLFIVGFGAGMVITYMRRL